MKFEKPEHMKKFEGSSDCSSSSTCSEDEHRTKGLTVGACTLGEGATLYL